MSEQLGPMNNAMDNEDVSRVFELTLEELQLQFPHKYRDPRIHASALILPGVQIIGDVEIGAHSSVWYNTVVRGDVHYVRIGECTNIQDCSLIHVSHHGSPTVIGDHVTVGHAVTLHACTIGNHVLVGMGSTVLDDAVLEDYVMLGAGSLVTSKTRIPSGSKAFGRPAKVVGQLTTQERQRIEWNARHYVRLAQAYLPTSSASAAAATRRQPGKGK